MAYQIESLGSEASDPLLRPAENDRSIGRWLLRVLAHQSARRRLRRWSGRIRVADVAELPPHLLRDIGLPHEFRPQDGLAQPNHAV